MFDRCKLPAGLILVSIICGIGFVACSSSSSRLTFADLKPFWWNAPPIIMMRDEEASETIDRIEFQTGKEAKNQVVAGHVDLAVVAATPIVLGAMAREDFVILGQYLTGPGLVAVISTNKEQLSEPVAIVKGTVSEFAYIKIAKERLGKDSQTTKVLALQPPSVLSALKSRQANSAIIWDPFAQQIERALPDANIERPSDLYQMNFFLIASRSAWKQRKNLIDHVTELFKRATDRANQPEGQKLVDEYVKSEGGEPGAWSENRVIFRFIDATKSEGRSEIIESLESEFTILKQAGLALDEPDFRRLLP